MAAPDSWPPSRDVPASQTAKMIKSTRWLLGRSVEEVAYEPGNGSWVITQDT
jgi:hypothetical protein